MLLAGFADVATAASPVGKDGKIHACYRVKGKPKGSLRVVPSTKKRCKRGERKVAWSVAGAAGQAGANGQAAGTGQEGQPGASGSSGGGEAALVTKVAALNLKVESLENLLDGVDSGELLGAVETLDGVNNAELTGAVDTLQGLTNIELTDAVETVEGLTNADLAGAVEAVEGLTNTDLTEAVDSLPVIDSLCTQASTVTEGINDLGLGITGISVLGLPGLSLNTSGLPGALDPFTCVAP